jgi:hypothetical protein
MAAPGTPSPLFPADNSAVTSHITMLQGIITRLANNSASCKTWCLTLIGALVSLSGSTHVPGIFSFTILPIVVFGFLDTMYLSQEKAYRDLFDEIAGKIRSGGYVRGDAFKAAAPLKAEHVAWAIRSWAVLPVYAGLILAYTIAHLTGWVNILAKK